MDELLSRIKMFFKIKGLIELHQQEHLSILNRLFSKERVEREVTQLFSKEYITRSYGIINMKSLLYCMNPI